MIIKRYNKFLVESVSKGYDYFRDRKYLDWDCESLEKFLSKIPNSKIFTDNFYIVYIEDKKLVVIDDDFIERLNNIDEDLQLSPSFKFRIIIESNNIKNNGLIEKDGIQETLSGDFLNWSYFTSIVTSIDNVLKELNDDFYIFFDIGEFTSQKSQDELKYDFIIELTMKDKFDKNYIIGE